MLAAVGLQQVLVPLGQEMVPLLALIPVPRRLQVRSQWRERMVQ